MDNKKFIAQDWFTQLPAGKSLQQDVDEPSRYISIDQIPQGRAIARMALRQLTPTPEKFYDKIPQGLGIYGGTEPLNINGMYSPSLNTVNLSGDTAKRLLERDTRSKAEIYPEIIKSILDRNPNIDAPTNTAQSTLGHELTHYFLNDKDIAASRMRGDYSYLAPDISQKYFNSHHGEGFGSYLPSQVGHVVSSMFLKQKP